MLKSSLLVVLCILTLNLAALADTLVLKDGTTLEGAVMKIGREYRVKTADGQWHSVPESNVKEVRRGNAPAAAGAPAATGAGGKPAAAGPSGKTVAPPAGNLPAGTSTDFANTKRRADAVDAPIVAVTLWEKFLEAKASPADLEAANVELEKWKQLDKSNAERINGKWLGGDDRKKLIKEVRQLINEGNEALAGTQTVQGIQKLEKALKLYPNSFEANFSLGYYYLTKGAIGATGRGNVEYLEKAIKSLEAASRIMPNSAATWSNLAIGYNFRSRFVDSVQAAYKAARIEDDKEIVQNLVNSIAHAPRGMQQNNARIKPIMEDAVILAGKHGLSLKGGEWHYIRPKPPGEGDAPGNVSETDGGRPGLVWMGSAFFITPDGYFITNHHVATGDPKSPIKKNISFRIRMDDGTEKLAELIAVDDAADIALMKIKTSSPVPYLKLADDNPRQASKALVLGYPATGDDNPTLQISEGQVKSLHPGDEHEVWLDLNTTHGNSGGPIVDRNCRVVAILTGGKQVHNLVYVLGVGPMQIKRFLDSLGEKAPNNVEWIPPGTGEFDGEALTEQARQSTLLVMAIRGAGGSSGDSTSDGDLDDEDSAEDAPAGVPAATAP
jgi:S1-C subfamily serine protease